MRSIEQELRRTSVRAVGLVLAVAALLAGLALAAAPGEAPGASQQRAGCALGERPAAELTVKELRKAVVCLINDARAGRDLDSLSRARKLQTAAKRHTRVIVDTGCFAHRCPGESDLEGRIRQAGYLTGAQRWGYGESTGCAESPAAMVSNWIETRFHRRNLLGGRFDDVGVGAAHGGPAERCEDGFATFTAVFAWRED